MKTKPLKQLQSHSDKNIHFGIIAIILLSFILAAYYYPVMPDRMISHWNSAGQPNGYMTKCWALYLMPSISVILYLLFLLLPKIDPMKKNFEKFRDWFDGFILVIITFLFYVYLLSLIANLGFVFNMTTMVMPAMGLLFIYIGYMMEHVKKNWFVGIRTPWTLSSDVVWKKTHMLAGKLFKMAGVFILCGIFLQRLVIWIVLFSVFWAAIYPVVYSYFEYKRLQK